MASMRQNDGVVTTYMDDGGPGAAGPTLLFVHGWAASGQFFGPQRAAFAGRARIVIPDLRGHGASRAADGDLTIDRLGADLAALLAHLDARDVIAVGWSMGAHVTWSALAQGARARLAALCVVDMSPRVMNDADWRLGLSPDHDAAAAERALAAMREDWPRFAAGFAPRLFAAGREAERADLAAWATPHLADNDAEAMARLWRSLIAQDFRPTLPGIDLPMLVAHGQGSQLYPGETAQAIARAAPRAHVRTFAQSGHALHLEEPDAFNAAISELAALTGHPGPRRGLESVRRAVGHAGTTGSGECNHADHP